ncbi:MAG: FprA family A-type flavoprotein [Candidatus Firestonebacteria bacterium]|nr:FprA family A-type flavoprotein [Candidatus Firestonebacteria bacterium]
MKTGEIKKGIYWVGVYDWDLRNFHGYITSRGSTYNAYLIVDDKIVLVDTVKAHFCEEMLARIKNIIDPLKIDYIISNHVEMDHSGSLPVIVEAAKPEAIITSPNGAKGLKRHFKKDWNFKIVNTGDSINIGKRNINFVTIPMVHWPDSMISFIPEEKLLLSNDAFGQHIASTERFDDELGFDIVKEEAAKYYANIVLPYGHEVNNALNALSSLEINMIAPSHGIIWRSHLKDIIELYKKWANNICDEKAVIVYDTMWGSTEKMAYVLKEAFDEKNIPCQIKNLKTNSNSEVITSILSAKYICIGSPTLNNGMLPSISSFLTYLKGLYPKNRIGIAFGSYGWGGQSVGDIENILESIKFNVPLKGLKIQYVPDENELIELKNKIKAVL